MLLSAQLKFSYDLVKSRFEFFQRVLLVFVRIRFLRLRFEFRCVQVENLEKLYTWLSRCSTY